MDEANGDVLVGDLTELEHNVYRPFVDVFEPTALGYVLVRKITGTSSGLFGTGGAISLAVDAGEGYVYVGHEGAIDQFDLGGEYLGQVSGFNGSLAVDQTTHRLFVGEEPKVNILGPTVVVPDPVTGVVSNVRLEGETHMWSVRLNGTVDPDNAGKATCHFVWGTSESFGQEAPCTNSVPNGSEPEPVRANISGLAPDTTYYYRLETENGQGPNVGEVSQDQRFTTAGPGLSSESVSAVSESVATLEATIVPHDAPVESHDLQPITVSPTAYYFQYSTQSTAVCAVEPAVCGQVPLEPESTGGGAGAVEVQQRLEGLSASTIYHYRLVAVSEVEPGRLEEFYEPDRTFTTQGPAAPFALLDRRAWELVSPPEKHGAALQPLRPLGGTVVQAAAGGDAVTYLASAPTEAAPAGYTNFVQVLSARAQDGGWVSRDLSTPHVEATGQSTGQGMEYRFFSSDLSLGILQPFGAFDPSLSPEASEQTPYLRTDFSAGDPGAFCTGSCYRPLVTGAAGFANVSPGTEFGEDVECTPQYKSTRGGQLVLCGPEFIGATPDLSHVLLTSNTALIAGASAGDYEWDRATGALTFLGTGGVGTARNGISSDGSRVIVGDLSVDSETGESVRFDAAEPGCGACASGGGGFQPRLRGRFQDLLHRREQAHRGLDRRAGQA